MTMRLSARSFAGTARTLVAVGTVSETFMFLTTLAAAPRRGDCVPAATGGAAVLAAGVAAGLAPGAVSPGGLGGGLPGAGLRGAGAAEVSARGGTSRYGAGESAGCAATG